MFNDSLFESTHLVMFVKELSTFLESVAGFLSLISIDISSANETEKELCDFIKSFVYIENRSGASMDPCGTPVFICCVLESISPNFIYCCLPLRYVSNHCKIRPSKPSLFNLVNRISWSIVSNALVKSSSRRTEESLFSKFLYSFSVRQISASDVERPFLKPNWKSLSNEFEVKYSVSCSNIIFSKILLIVWVMDIGL